MFPVMKPAGSQGLFCPSEWATPHLVRILTDLQLITDVENVRGCGKRGILTFQGRAVLAALEKTHACQ